jgi:hypothetical protein
MDWEAKSAIHRVLADLSPEDLGEIYARLTPQDEPGGTHDLGRMVGARWAASDPDAAIKAAFAKSRMRGEFFASVIIREWSADHPREALEWLNTTELDPRLAKRKDELKGNIVAGLSQRDFTLAKEELAKLGDKEAKDVIERWGHANVIDAAMREKLIDYAKSTGNPADFAALNRGLVSEWPQNDPLGLMNHLQDLQAYLESDAVPISSQPEADAAAVGIAIRREYHDAALEWWMGRYSQSNQAPEPLREAISKWCGEKPDVALQWLESQPESPQRDALSAAAAPVLLGKGNFAKAAEIIESINDAGLRQLGTERLEILWKEKDPGAAAAWKNGLSN